MPELRVISMGCLPAHPLWGERRPVRAGHATTTLIRAGSAVILVDPGLGEEAIVQRLAERANLRPADVTHVFLTSFHPDTHRGITAFDDAEWLISRAEREAVGVPMASALRHAIEQGNTELRGMVERDVAILAACNEADETIADRVDLFPLPGVTPGLCGLIIEDEETTTVICGDAVPTIEHLAQRKLLPWASDIRAANASFNEALEIADLLVLGRDNIVVSPGTVAIDRGPHLLEDDEDEPESDEVRGDGGDDDGDDRGAHADPRDGEPDWPPTKR